MNKDDDAQQILCTLEAQGKQENLLYAQQIQELVSQKLRLILSSLQQQLQEIQNKFASEQSKLIKQVQQKDKLIHSLTNINNGLMKDNARLKRKSDAQFQYFVKRIAQTQCNALNQKRQLQQLISGWQKAAIKLNSKKNKQLNHEVINIKSRSSINPEIYKFQNLKNQLKKDQLQNNVQLIKKVQRDIKKMHKTANDQIKNEYEQLKLFTKIQQENSHSVNNPKPKPKGYQKYCQNLLKI